MLSNSGVLTVYGNGSFLLEPASKKSTTFSVKVGLTQMLRGRVIMDVVDVEQARIAEEAGARPSVMRMSNPTLIRDIKRVVTIPVMAKAWIGHFVETIEVDYVDESEVLTPADDAHHINKHNFWVPG